MKRQIRTGVFETNSSSIHTIAIPYECPSSESFFFCIGEYGWEWGEANPVPYLYTAIYETSHGAEEVEAKIERLKEILDTHDIKYCFEPVSVYEDLCTLSDGYIDHGYELEEFVNDLLKDDGKLIRFLSGGLVFTGNDNGCDDEEWGYLYRNQKTLESWGGDYIDNPYYDPEYEKYEWLEKGN